MYTHEHIQALVQNKVMVVFFHSLQVICKFYKTIDGCPNIASLSDVQKHSESSPSVKNLSGHMQHKHGISMVGTYDQLDKGVFQVCLFFPEGLVALCFSILTPCVKEHEKCSHSE